MKGGMNLKLKQGIGNEDMTSVIIRIIKREDVIFRECGVKWLE